MIDVSISHLQRSQRRALMLGPVRRISVYGKAEVQNGKLSIDAHRVVVQPSVTAPVSDEAGEAVKPRKPSTTANEFSETKTRNVEFVACRVPRFPFKEN